MPPHVHYVEPYAGGLSVLLAKDPEGVSEVVNDLNADLTNFWACLQNEFAFAQLQRFVEAVPFSESEYLDSVRPLTTDGVCDKGYPSFSVIQAVRFFIRCRQSLAGRMQAFAPLSRTRTRRGMNEQASAWINAVDGLPAVHARLRRVVVLNRPALDVIRQQDGPDTLFYLDPPYLHETRATTKEYGAHEMSDKDHGELLEVLTGIKGRFLLSGYRSKLYDGVAGISTSRTTQPAATRSAA
jgi:DNA adenine methylase